MRSSRRLVQREHKKVNKKSPAWRRRAFQTGSMALSKGSPVHAHNFEPRP